MMIFVFGVLLAAILSALVYVDWRERLLPDWLNLTLAICGLAQSLWIGAPELSEALTGSVVGGALMLAVALGYKRLRGIDGLGLGDVKLVAAGMLWIESRWLGPMLLMATLSALIVMLSRAALLKRLDPREPFSFGPFLALAIFGCWSLSIAGY